MTTGRRRSGDPLRVTIVGAGLSGISQAIQLVRHIARHQLELLIVEKDDAIGGTWLNSTWPGAGVDVPIHLYSLELEPRSNWKSVFAEQKDVLAYLEDCVDRNGKSSKVPMYFELIDLCCRPTIVHSLKHDVRLVDLGRHDANACHQPADRRKGTSSARLRRPHLGQWTTISTQNTTHPRHRSIFWRCVSQPAMACSHT